MNITYDGTGDAHATARFCELWRSEPARVSLLWIMNRTIHNTLSR